VTVFLEEYTPCSVLEVEGTLRAPIDMTLRQKVEALLSCGQRRIVLNLARLPQHGVEAAKYRRKR
jgi:hypothetical protein